MLFVVLFQPTETKALVNTTHLSSFCTFSKAQIEANHQKGPILLVDSIFMDAEDEDEFSEIENHTSNETIQYIRSDIAQIPIQLSVDPISNEYHLIDPSPTNPLYILWGVFRI